MKIETCVLCGGAVRGWELIFSKRIGSDRVIVLSGPLTNRSRLDALRPTHQRILICRFPGKGLDQPPSVRTQWLRVFVYCLLFFKLLLITIFEKLYKGYVTNIILLFYNFFKKNLFIISVNYVYGFLIFIVFKR